MNIAENKPVTIAIVVVALLLIGLIIRRSTTGPAPEITSDPAAQMPAGTPPQPGLGPGATGVRTAPSQAPGR